VWGRRVEAGEDGDSVESVGEGAVSKCGWVRQWVVEGCECGDGGAEYSEGEEEGVKE
jgi:hypothetical protein